MKYRIFKSRSTGDFLKMTKQPNFLERIEMEHKELVARKVRGTYDHFSRPENFTKNRHIYFPCWDHSRVILKPPSTGIPTIYEIACDYIHANYVDGFTEKKKFICTQSPMKNTMFDFWRMVYQENCHIIMSITKIDNTKEYFYHYWFNNKHRDLVFGRYAIRLLGFIEEKSLIRARIRLTDTKRNISREIYHFWFTNGPFYYGRRVNSLELLNLIIQVDQKREELRKKVDSGPGPIVIHCSRIRSWSGIFCTIDNALSQVREKNTVSIPKTIRNIRKQLHSSMYGFEEYESCYAVLWTAILQKKLYEHGYYKLSCLPPTEAAIVNYFFPQPD
ncbi:tyrosine-protein phosphatase non-receptor type 9-like [Microplitis mediator]|uniref:tyrosine-protein phosphatase non-receptor type 9-like n=1 Tax=Microplitis mediator TaxID=375433 RepID=UPI0025554857|nr:tyrosine-protein phosphatase non-receptor type 9-like [Microplitis mediator]